MVTAFVLSRFSLSISDHPGFLPTFLGPKVYIHPPVSGFTSCQVNAIPSCGPLFSWLVWLKPGVGVGTATCLRPSGPFYSWLGGWSVTRKRLDMFKRVRWPTLF